MHKLILISINYHNLLTKNIKHVSIAQNHTFPKVLCVILLFPLVQQGSIVIMPDRTLLLLLRSYRIIFQANFVNVTRFYFLFQDRTLLLCFKIIFDPFFSEYTYATTRFYMKNFRIFESSRVRVINVRMFLFFYS